MPTKFILSFLKIAVTILYYFLAVITVVILATSVIQIYSGQRSIKHVPNNAYSYQVQRIDKRAAVPPFTYATDSTVSYQPQNDHFTVNIEPRSGIGYYTLLMKLIFLGFGLAILWHFKNIFSETNLDRPFRYSIIRRLKILASLFIISDVVKGVDYILFNSLLRQALDSPKFALITDIGSGFITGAIIWIIAVIYQRGMALEEENALTV